MTAAVPAPHAVLCAHQLGKASKDVPKSAVSRAGNQSALPDKLTTGGGSWTWINLWAAWCVPCKEEMPRLKSWEAKTAGERSPLRVLFVSLDDDARQLETFLGAQPPTGIHSTYWLQDGNERKAWLKEAGFDDGPELPGHLLVDPSGKVRCKQQGAVDDTDFGEVQKILRGERGGTGAGTGGGTK
jgi:thiol-disulfide isomerase/thioredoxin